MLSSHDKYATYPLAVCIDTGKGLRLIDGYHRLRAAEECDLKKVKVIVGVNDDSSRYQAP